LILNLKEKMRGLAKELPLQLVVLFGSYVQGRYTVASDIDILVVYEGKERSDAFKIVKRSLDIPLLEPHIYSRDEYRRLEKSIERMTAGGVTLFP
jgi:predicted nucleotidyltransferase